MGERTDMEIRKEQFENIISVQLRNNHLQEPLINWYGELYVKHNIDKNQITLFKLIQSLKVLEDYKEIYASLETLNSIEKGLVTIQATAYKMEGKSEEEIIKKFDSMERFRVAYALCIVQREDEKNLQWFYNLNPDEQHHLYSLAENTANALRSM